MGFSERFIQLAVGVCQVPSRYLEARLPKLRDDILSSNLNIAPEGLISISIFITILLVPFVVVGDYLLLKSGFPIGVLFLTLSLIVPVALGLSLPRFSASSRSTALDSELPFIIGYIAVMAGGGISPYATIKRVSDSASIFPAGAKEAKRIVMDVELFGMDPVSAFQKASLHTPNKRFSDFLVGYISVLKAGGSVTSYLQAQLREIYAYNEGKTKVNTDTIGTFSEGYIISTVILGISLFVLYITQSLLTGASQGVNPFEIELFAIVFVPVISITFIVIINSIQIKEPYTYYLPYYVFLACIPIGVAFLLLRAPGSSQLHPAGISLAVVSTPAAIVNERYIRRKRAVEEKLHNFVRDIAEIRKTGLAPERSIEEIAGGNYGGLTPYIKKISNQLGWGISMTVVLENLGRQVKSWLTRAITFLMLEVVDAGGGSPVLFVELAEFTEKTSQLNRDRRSQVRPYVVIPYIGAVLIVVTTALMVYLLSGPGLSVGSGNGISFIAPASVINKATTILFLAAFFQAWVMGIVAGKMGELTVADGFKHATLIVIISIITVYAAAAFVKF